MAAGVFRRRTRAAVQTDFPRTLSADETGKEGWYWLDGDRGYVTTRLNLDQLQFSREEAIEQNVCVEDEYSMRNLQRSPMGFWYPILVVRQTAQEPKEPGEKRVLTPSTSTAFLLDFVTDIPDSHFTTKDRPSGF